MWMKEIIIIICVNIPHILYGCKERGATPFSASTSHLISIFFLLPSIVLKFNVTLLPRKVLKKLWIVMKFYFFLRDSLHLFLYPLFHYFTIQSSMINKPSGYELNWLKKEVFDSAARATLPYNSIDKWLLDRFISINSVSTITFDFIHFYVPIFI